MDGRGPAVRGLAAGEVVPEAQLRNLFGEGRHPHADRIEAGLLAPGRSVRLHGGRGARTPGEIAAVLA
ncbi:hypothetical protein ACFY5C_33565 [Streptomyces sp. NPDC012935]|uniref:hypothetical protein n=1 Tax=Streptomyces sp. NPDC012935 TaxID=3364857 RepID=UPI003678F70A